MNAHVQNSGLERDFYYLSFILKKTEKLVTAVYLITDFLNSNEPLKWEIRSKVVRLMSFVSTVANQSSLGSSGSSTDGVPFNRAVGAITDLIALLELAVSLRFISEMNFSILRDEFASVRGLIEGRERSNNPIADVSFSQGFFAAGEKPQILPHSASRAVPRPAAKEAHLSADQPAMPAHAGHATASSPSEQSVLDAPADKEYPGKEHRIYQVDSMTRRGEKNLRKEAILKFLRSRSGVSIKDIAGVIPNCSEKTVQRELSELIDAGVVERAGERRWSVYSLGASNTIPN